MLIPSIDTLPATALRSPASTSARTCCPFPETPAMPKISPSCTEKETPFRARSPLSFRAERLSTSRMGLPCSTSTCSSRKITSRPTISLARLFSVASDVRRRAVTLPRRRTVTRSLMASTMGSLWVMNGTRARSSPVMMRIDCQELLRFRRRQGGGGLIQDEDPGASIQGLQDLDRLLLALRQLPDLGLEVDLEAVAVADLGDLVSGPLQVGNAARFGMAQDDVLEDRVSGDQLAVLVNHADAEVNGVQGRVEGHLLPVNVDLAFVGLEQPEQDLHQGGLAGAVLTQDGVDLTGSDLKVDVVIGDDPGESLGDSPWPPGRYRRVSRVGWACCQPVACRWFCLPPRRSRSEAGSRPGVRGAGVSADDRRSTPLKREALVPRSAPTGREPHLSVTRRHTSCGPTQRATSGWSCLADRS